MSCSQLLQQQTSKQHVEQSNSNHLIESKEDLRLNNKWEMASQSLQSFKAARSFYFQLITAVAITWQLKSELGQKHGQYCAYLLEGQTLPDAVAVSKAEGSPAGSQVVPVAPGSRIGMLCMHHLSSSVKGTGESHVRACQMSTTWAQHLLASAATWQLFSCVTWRSFAHLHVTHLNLQA